MHDDEHGWGHRERIGDVEVHVYEDGHVNIDERRLVRNVKHKADVWVGQKIFGCAFTIFFFILFAGLILGAGWYLMFTVQSSDSVPPSMSSSTDQNASPSASKSAVKIPKVPDFPDLPTSTKTEKVPLDAPSGWDGKSTLVCKGNDRISVQNVTARLPGKTAIKAINNCKLTLIDVRVEESDIALFANGNAKVEVKRGRLAGKKKAIDATAIAKIRLVGTDVKGKTTTKSLAKITKD